MYSFRVVIAGLEAESKNRLVEMLKRLGCNIVGCTHEPDAVVNLVRTLSPDLVIMEGVPAFLDAALTVKDESLAPLLVYSGKIGRPFFTQLKERWGFAFIGEPEGDKKWRAAILLAVEKFHKKMETSLARKTINSGKTTRQVVREAQDYLVEKMGISKMQALYLIQIQGCNGGLSLRQVAEKIISDCRISKETA